MGNRTALRSICIILTFFSFLWGSAFCIGTDALFAQEDRISKEASIPGPLTKGDFRFLTNLSVVPGDTYVDLFWTPFWQDEGKGPPKGKEPMGGLFNKRAGEKLFLNDLLKEDETSLSGEESDKYGADRDTSRNKYGEQASTEMPKEKEIVGYILHFGTESKNYTKKIDVGDVTKYRIRGLSNYVTYFFAVQAYTKLKEFSELSEEVFAVSKPEEELMSSIEKGFAEEEIPQTISREMKQFGYDFFHFKASGSTPLSDAPVGPDYTIGPGDSLTISLWGRIETAFSVEVDRNGEIILPKVGVMKVWGLTFSQLEKNIHRELSKYYSGFQMNITMDRLRTIRVFIVGEAKNPGSYTISSISTVYNALIAAGGPSKKGTLRSIQLIRKGDIVKTVDLYRFLLKGDKSQDERLQSGDTIFIPVVGPVVGITGNVKRPSIYEMKEILDLGELMDLAGGVTFLGYLQRVQVERIEAHEKKVVADFDISEKREDIDMRVPLQDGDLVKVFSVLPITQDVVYLEGHVKRSGGFEFHEGMKLLELIPSFDHLLPEPYLDYAEITRLVPPDFHPATLSFHLGKLLSGDPSQNLGLREYDRITIYSREKFKAIPQVIVSGEVRSPGSFRLLGNMRVKDLIYASGNLKRSAYLPEGEITRLTKTEKGVTSEVIKINLYEVLKDNPKHNLVLAEDDSLFIRQIPDWYTERTVELKGEVKFPGAYTFSKGERLSSVLTRAGGFTEHAYLKGAFFTRESAKKAQEERLEEFADRLEMDILNAQASSPEEQSLLSIKKELLSKLRASKVTGRVVIVLDSLEKFKGFKYDLELENGDTLTIPEKPGIVNVLGSVYNPTSIVYTSRKTVSFYLNKVGGPTPDAEKGNIYVIKADGTVVSKTQKGTFGLSWDSAGKRWLSSGFMSSRIDPGDTILVPAKLTRFVWKREILDWTQILYQIAVSAGVIVAAF